MSGSREEHILITGAAGFVGSRLVKLLRVCMPDAYLTLVDHGQKSTGIKSIDVADEVAVSALIAEARPTMVVHLAAISAISNAVADHRLTWRVNALAPYNFVNAILESAPDCHLLFVSSAEVYGRSALAGEALTEQTLLQPSNPYASAKAAADLLIQEACGRGLKATIVRPFNHIGPGQSLNFAVPSFCSQIAAIERGDQMPVMNVGSLEDERDFLHVDDVIDLYLKVIDRRAELPNGLVLNVASGIPVKMQQVLDYLVTASSEMIDVRIDPARLRGRPPSRIWGDATRAREVIGWFPAHNLQETLLETLTYWRETGTTA